MPFPGDAEAWVPEIVTVRPVECAGSLPAARVTLLLIWRSVRPSALKTGDDPGVSAGE
ncbi:hypothetical protein GCM10010371_62630 [Streptomyces subrutilus]|uniref:Uncharacterized protein n=1 Tax=Streptomyces subrutilus TaxID=36818 RepID=A0A918RBY6_9ACTN|nr:hypothetical protein GCM10010371_62630 [Streptomyces subrutilus]